MAWNEPGNRDENPWNKNNRNDGPPDLDELFRRIQQKITSLFGGGGTPTGLNKAGLLGLAIGLLVVWLVFGYYTVNEQERAIVLRFGKYHETLMPGFAWRPLRPIGIDRIYKVNITNVRSLSHEALMLTEDDNIIDVKLSVQYLVSDPKLFLLNIKDPEASLQQASESALRHVVGGSKLDPVLGDGRVSVAAQVKARIQQYMENYQSGIQISQVTIDDAQAPEAVRAAFFNVSKAQEDKERFENEAQTYANGVVPEAKGQAARKTEEAKGYQSAVIARAEGETARFLGILGEYKKAPEVTRQRLYIDAMQTMLSNSSKVMIDTKSGNPLFYVPLEQFLKNKPASTQQNTSETAAKVADDNAPEAPAATRSTR